MGDAEVPGWRCAALGEVVDILDSRRVPVNAEERARRPGRIPYFGATGQVGWIDAHLFDEDLVLLGEDGAPFFDPAKPKAYRVAGRAWVNNHAHVLRARSGILNAFVLHQLNQVDYRPYVSGTTRLKLPQAPMRNIPLLIAPTTEQLRIVAEIEKHLSRIDAAVAALKRAQENLKRYRASVLAAACAGRLVPDATKLRWVSLKSAIVSIDQGWSPLCDRAPSDDAEIWAVIKTTAIQSLQFRAAENKTLPTSLDPRAELQLAAGDVLMTRAGPRARVGVACLVRTVRPRLMLCDKAYRLRCSPNIIRPAFLETVLNAPQIVEELDKLKTGISDSGVNLTQKRLGEMQIPAPTVENQAEVVAEVDRRLSVVDAMQAAIDSNLFRADRLRQSVLKRAFEGKLVPQDPNDEPASVLLERIRAERASQPAASSARRPRPRKAHTA